MKNKDSSLKNLNFIILASMLFIASFAIIATAANMQEGELMINQTISPIVTEYNGSSVEIIFKQFVSTGTQPQTLNEGETILDVLVTMLPLNISDADNLIADKNFTTDIVWHALSLTLNNTFGQVKFLGLINLSTRGTNLTITSNINISENNITVNISSLEELNISTEMTIFDVYLENVSVQKNGTDCIECTILNYSDEDLAFNVSGFISEYSSYQASNESTPAVHIRISRNITVLSSNITITGDSYNGSWPSNVTLDVGFDGLIEWNHTYTLDTTNTTTNMTDALNLHLTDCSCLGCTIVNDVTCLIPATLSSDTQGTVEVSNLNISQAVNNFTWPQFTNFTAFDFDDIFYDENEDVLDYTIAFRPETNVSTLLYCTFDSSTTCETDEIANVTEVDITSAVFFNGSLINTSGNMSFITSDILDITKGTLELWLIPDWNGSDTQRYIIMEMNTSGDGNYISLYKNESGYLVGEIRDSSDNAYNVSYNISSWLELERHHIAFSWQADDMKIYTDGVLRDTQDVAIMASASSTLTFIGSNNRNEYHINATIDELRIQDIVDTTFYNITPNMELNITVSDDIITFIPSRYYNGSKEVRAVAFDNRTYSYSNIFNLTITADTVAPIFSDNADNSTGTNPRSGEDIQMNITITDNIELYNYTFSWDDTGSWQNDSVEYTGAIETINLSFNKTTSAAAGSTVSWRVFAWDIYGNLAASDIYTFTTKNNGPSTSTPVITPATPNRSSILNCTFTVTDADIGDTLTANVTFFRDGIYNTSINMEVTNGEEAGFNLTANYTNKGEWWNCSVQPYDGATYGDWINSTSRLILNSPPPIVTLYDPTVDNITTNRSVFFNWSAVTDIDGDSVKYEILVECNGGCSIDNRFENTTFTNLTLVDFQYFEDDGYNYTWYVKSWDTDDESSASELRNYSINSLLMINFLNNVVDFGSSLTIGESNDTTDDLPLPIIIENLGNTLINISIYASTELWINAPVPTSFYQFKVDNYSIETGSFNATESIVDFTNIPASALKAIADMDYNLTNNTVEVDINVTVPAAEPPGTKNSTLIFEYQRADS